MTLAAAARYAADRIRFNLIAPGLIDTPMADPGRRRPGDPRLPRRPSSRWPAGRARPTTAPRPPSTSASPPRGSSPAPCWRSTAAGASPRGSDPERDDPMSDPDAPDVLRAIPRAPSARRSTRSRRPSSPRSARRRSGSPRRSSPGRLVHVFGTGHSRMAVEEMFPRYGSFPGFHPIVELSMTYPQPGRRRQRPAAGDVPGERPGVRPGPLAELRRPTRPTALLAISTSGCNAVTDRRGARGQAARHVRRRPDLAAARRGLDLEARVGPEAVTRWPTWCSTSTPPRATRPSGSTGSRRRSRRSRASPAARSST